MHWGIEIRARMLHLPKDQQIVMMANSDALHTIGKFSGREWTSLLGAPILDANGAPKMEIEYRSLWLPDQYGTGEEITRSWKRA